MRKRIIAFICLLAMLLSLMPLNGIQVEAAVEPAVGGAYQVGYAKVDINPYVNGEDYRDGLLRLPLWGTTTSMSRLSNGMLLDDNGDGQVDEKDGIFATCIAVTGTNGETVLLYSVDLLHGEATLVADVRSSVVAALQEQGVTIPAENVQIQGTHTHSSVDISQVRDIYNPADGSHKDQIYTLTGNDGKPVDENHDGVADTITAGEVYAILAPWREVLVTKLTEAAVKAVTDRAPATLCKGQIKAGDAAGKSMNAVRDYIRVTEDENGNPVPYVSGTHFNSSNVAHSGVTYQLADANDTMYCLQFRFENKKPIALVNWRGHPNSIAPTTSGTRLYISSDYVGATNRVLEDSGYRPMFMQGASGNITIRDPINDWLDEANTDANNDGEFTGTEVLTNAYGSLLGQVALQCLSQSNMQQLSAGEVKVTSLEYYASEKIWTDPLQLEAALAVQTLIDVGVEVQYPYLYPDYLYTNSNAHYDLLTAQQKTAADVSLAANASYAIASNFHVGNVKKHYSEDGTAGTQQVSLSSFMLGDQVAFVTAPGEMYDWYNDTAVWKDQSGSTPQDIHNWLMSCDNKWDELNSSSYGTPFVMGYANGSIGYVPNSISYEYNQHNTLGIAEGSYGAHSTNLEQGTGESILDIYQNMLECLTSDTVDNEHYRVAYCQGCQKSVLWEAMSDTYNGNNVANDGHYFLEDDVTITAKTISNGTFCLDLRGKQCNAAASRAFIVEAGGVLNISDTLGGGSVYGIAHNQSVATNSGGTIRVNTGGTLNFYGGTIRHAEDRNLYNGGVLYIQGTFNMYGGTIEGSNVTKWGGGVYVHASGSMTVSGGTLTSGTLVVNETYPYAGPCVYSDGSVTISADPVIENLYLSKTGSLNVSGTFSGAMELTCPTVPALGTVVGNATADARILTTDITIEGNELTLGISGTQLVVAEPNPCVFGHSFHTVMGEPTCAGVGYHAYICDRCGYTYYDSVVPATGHSYRSVITAPTCTKEGFTTYTCTVCGDSYVADVVPAAGHSWVDATCTDARYCFVCGIADGAAPGHSLQSVVTAPSCSTVGYTTHVCTLCTYTFYDSIVPATGHSYEPIVIPPTCTKDGYTIFICMYCDDCCIGDVVSSCGHSWVEATCVDAQYCQSCGISEGAALGHSYTNGGCTACGVEDPDFVKPVVTPNLTLKSPALEFKDRIKVIAFFTAENIEDVVEMGMVTYTEQVDVIDVNTAAHVIPGAEYEAGTGRYYASSQGINAKYLADTVYLACYAKLTDGSYVYTKLAPYSPITYAINQLKNSTNNELKQLVAAMLNYGAAAQMYFNYNVENLANASLTAEQLALPDSYREDMVSTVPAADASKQGVFANNKGFSLRKPAVSFEGAFSINYFFTPAYVPVDGITLYYWTEADFNAADVLTLDNATGSVTMEPADGGQYRGDITGIAAKNIAQAVYVAAVYSDGTTTWTSGVLGYSIGAYCASLATKGGTAADLAMATAVYGYHAKQYFG